jgi:hypothetical protein
MTCRMHRQVDDHVTMRETHGALKTMGSCKNVALIVPCVRRTVK